VGRIYLGGDLEDEDIEVYNTPAQILPRLITLGESYPYTADLESGSYDDAVVFEEIDFIDTGMGSAEGLKVVTFSEGDTPLVLWLGRNLGYLEAILTTTADGQPLTATGSVTGMDVPFIWESVQAYWADTINHGDGWRQSEWFGYFWVPYIESRWIYMWGVGWTYCMGNSSDMWMYMTQVPDWFWTSESYYPWMYSDERGTSLRHQTGSLWFWDVGLNDWINLGP
jgi:hypothetical protein